jgi:hypothetical protein
VQPETPVKQAQLVPKARPVQLAQQAQQAQQAQLAPSVIPAQLV